MDLLNAADEWNGPTMMERSCIGDDAAAKQTPASSCFTAINRQPVQMPTPPQSSAPVPILQNQARRRNPAVASYLGLGASPEHDALGKHACLLPMPNGSIADRPKRKRRSQDSESNVPAKRANPANKGSPKHKNASYPCAQTGSPPYDSIYGESGRASSSAIKFLAPFGEPIHEPKDSNRRISHHSSGGRSDSTRTISRPDTFVTSPTKSSATIGFSDFESDNHDFDAKSLSDDSYGHLLNASIFDDDNCFDEDIPDSELLTAISELTGISVKDSTPICSPVRSSAAQNVDSHADGPGSPADTPIIIEDDARQRRSTAKKFVSPVTSTTRLLAMSGKKVHEPIVRSPFPTHVHDRSPIIGLTSNTLLRTCFRIGEAINQCSIASKSSKNIIIELYARVFDSTRDDYQQHFKFCDLFHARPPYIKAKFSASIWEPVPLFDYDSKRLLQEGRVCRCIGMMKRDGKEWKMTILNIWEASWEDIDWARGVVDS